MPVTGHLQPSCAVPSDGSLSPDSCRAPRMLLTAESGQKRSFREFDNRCNKGCVSTFRQPRLAQPIDMMLGILGVLVDGKTFPASNCEPRVDSQHLPRLFLSLLNLSRPALADPLPIMHPLPI